MESLHLGLRNIGKEKLYKKRILETGFTAVIEFSKVSIFLKKKNSIRSTDLVIMLIVLMRDLRHKTDNFSKSCHELVAVFFGLKLKSFLFSVQYYFSYTHCVCSMHCYCGLLKLKLSRFPSIFTFLLLGSFSLSSTHQKLKSEYVFYT